MRLDEQEITNAICLHYAERVKVDPSMVDVQLAWEEETGFTGQIWIADRDQMLVEANIVEAIERFLIKERNVRVFRNQIQLDLDEEIIAVIDI
jgi:hypothetical protein